LVPKGASFGGREKIHAAGNEEKEKHRGNTSDYRRPALKGEPGKKKRADHEKKKKSRVEDGRGEELPKGPFRRKKEGRIRITLRKQNGREGRAGRLLGGDQRQPATSEKSQPEGTQTKREKTKK